MKCAIDELIGNDEVGRLMFLFKRSNGGHREDALDAEFLEGVNVRAEVQFRRKYAMAATMACEKSYFAAFEFPEHEWV